MENQKNESLIDEIAELKQRLDQIELFNRTLLRLLIQKNVVGPNEFKNQMDELDLEDGSLDRK
ncbi:MAG: hypothetical protein CMJ78_08625 [Planctomycetaceae bacterium]|nr:hypothetical protein [Planctomycetaceae bacterium]